jgi:hypothetical protein
LDSSREGLQNYQGSFLPRIFRQLLLLGQEKIFGLDETV